MPIETYLLIPQPISSVRKSKLVLRSHAVLTRHMLSFAKLVLLSAIAFCAWHSAMGQALQNASGTPRTTEQKTAESKSATAAEQPGQGTSEKLVKNLSCNCGCAMDVAECRLKDPSCKRSIGITDDAARGLRSGNSEEVIRATIRNKYRVWEGPREISVENSPATGAAQPKLTLVEFGDFQCPACAEASSTISSLLAKHPADIQFVFKQFPLAMHSQAELAAESSLAAGAQGKFWEMYRMLFSRAADVDFDHVVAWARELELDTGRFTQDLSSHKYQPIVKRDQEQGKELGVTGTPTLFVNGKRYLGKIELQHLEDSLQSLRTAQSSITDPAGTKGQQ